MNMTEEENIQDETILGTTENRGKLCTLRVRDTYESMNTVQKWSDRFQSKEIGSDFKSNRDWQIQTRYNSGGFELPMNA